MSDQENFDELIRQKLQGRKFDFEETKWNKALGMIEADEKKKKRRWAWLFFFAGLLAVLGTAGLFLINSSTFDKSASSNETTTTHSTSSTSKNDADQGSSSSSNLAQQPLSSTDTQTAGGTNTSSFDPNIISPGNATTSQGSTTTYSPTGTSTDKPLTNGNGGTNITATSDGKSSIKTTYTKSSIPAPVKEKDPVITSTTGTGPVKQPVITEDPNTSHSPPDHPVSVPDSGKTLASITKPPVQTDTMPEQQAPMPDTSKSKDPLTKPNDPTANNEPVTDHAFHFFVSGGVNYFYGYSFSDTSHLGRTIDPFAGLGTTRNIGKNFGLVTGIFFRSLSKVSSLTKVSGDTTFGLGYVRARTDYKAKSLYYLDVPVWLTVSLGKKNSLLFGPDISYLMTTSSSVTTYDESYGNVSGIRTGKVYGYMDGFKRIDLGLTAGYSRKLIDRLYLDLHVHYGLFDVKKNSYFLDNIADHEMSAQVFIRYHLFK